MKEKHITPKISKLKQEFSWNYVFWTLEDLFEKWYVNDKQYNDLLNNLLTYVELKINPPDGSGDIVKRYVVVEYEENQTN
ncbi:MAG: hypothetical protein K2G42_02725 [Clostridia bacterium]|nr:hypothetical protein [Clostridia bacterium]